MNTLEILKAGRALLADPAHWTKGSLARDEKGKGTQPNSPEACSWCTYGVIMKVMDSKSRPEGQVIAPLQKALGHRMGLATFNDSHSHQEVLAVFDKAITLCQSTTTP